VGTILAIAALAVSIVSAILAFRSWRASDRSAGAAERSAGAADRSATAAESADRREREPRLSLWLDHPEPAPGDRVIYRIRNDGPQDLSSVVVYRPRPQDGITYPLAVPGDPAGWADDEIELGALTVTQESTFTLCCGAAALLPEFVVRIVCKSGPDEWLLSRALPPPRGEPLSEDERARRQGIMSEALVEIEANIGMLEGTKWTQVPLSSEALSSAYRLLYQHAPNWIGPIRDAIDGLRSLRLWVEQRHGSFPGGESEDRRKEILPLLSGAHAEINRMIAALVPGRSHDRSWNN
jgi:hypothetical protein